jgi:uncharacterized protein YkwD
MSAKPEPGIIEESHPRLTTADTPDTFVPSEEELILPADTEGLSQASEPGEGAGSVTAFSVEKTPFALDRINLYRGKAGVPAASMHPALQAAAESHVQYYNLNGSGNYSIHDQIEGKPGFSGKDFFARAAKFGYPNSESTNENIDTTADPVLAVDRLMATLNHRIPILDPAYPDMGIACGSNAEGKNPITVIDFGMPTWKTSFLPEFIIWPVEGSTNFPRSYRGEGPDLFRRSGLNPTYPIGNPITITYRGPGKIVFDLPGMSLTDTSGNEIPSYKLADLNFFWTARNSAAISSIQPLTADTTYRVTFTYSVNGGAKQVRTWTFSTGTSLTTKVVDPQPGLINADPSIRNLWQFADGPVAAGKVRRSWLYGPEVFDARFEPYDQAPGGKRVVYYFDKARLEINNPNGDRSNPWYVTSGLLTKELVSGFMQVGDSRFEQRASAQVPVAGDPAAVNQNAPTYASFLTYTSLNSDKRSQDRTGQTVLEQLSKDGKVTKLTAAPSPVICKQFEKTLGHNIPDVFLAYMNTLSGGWLFVLGYPVSEPYWMRSKVAGTEQDVLAQLFERRVLTYTPSNPVDWRVEMGNIGRHYFAWRYGG